MTTLALLPRERLARSPHKNGDGTTGTPTCAPSAARELPGRPAKPESGRSRYDWIVAQTPRPSPPKSSMIPPGGSTGTRTRSMRHLQRREFLRFSRDPGRIASRLASTVIGLRQPGSACAGETWGRRSPRSPLARLSASSPPLQRGRGRLVRRQPREDRGLRSVRSTRLQRGFRARFWEATCRDRPLAQFQHECGLRIIVSLPNAMARDTTPFPPPQRSSGAAVILSYLQALDGAPCESNAPVQNASFGRAPELPHAESKAHATTGPWAGACWHSASIGCARAASAAGWHDSRRSSRWIPCRYPKQS